MEIIACEINPLGDDPMFSVVTREDFRELDALGKKNVNCLFLLLFLIKYYTKTSSLLTLLKTCSLRAYIFDAWFGIIRKDLSIIPN